MITVEDFTELCHRLQTMWQQIRNMRYHELSHCRTLDDWVSTVYISRPRIYFELSTVEEQLQNELTKLKARTDERVELLNPSVYNEVTMSVLRIQEALFGEMEDLPLLIFCKDPTVALIAKYRLEIGR